MSLTHAQRTRLIRTTRKLAAMLGDTPTVEISNSSTPSTTTLSRSPQPPRINVTLPMSSPIDSISIFSPSSPTVDDVKRMRRKRIAKLSHTFGQSVPPELVIADSARSSDSSSFLDLDFDFDTKSDLVCFSSSESLLISPFPPPGLKAPLSPTRPNHRYAASVDDSRSPDKDLAFAKLVQHSDSSLRERQQSWSGEWNQVDMEEIQAKLRRLK